MSIDTILDEYVNVTMKINNVLKIISQYKDTIKQKIENAKLEGEKKLYIDQFRDFIQNIKNDNDIINKYKLLKIRQCEIRKKIITVDPSNDTGDIDILHILRHKYNSVFVFEDTTEIDTT